MVSRQIIIITKLFMLPDYTLCDKPKNLTKALLCASVMGKLLNYRVNHENLHHRGTEITPLLW